MAEVGDGRCPERALRALKVEMVRPKLVEDDGDVLKVLCPGGAVDKNVIKENKGRRTSFIRAWKVAGALARPKGITKNSKWPWWVRNAVLAMSSGCMRT